MTRTRKALIFVLSAIFVVCIGMFTLSACKSKKAVESIKITTPPDKIVYIDGETFDKTGMVVTAYYDDQSEQVLEATAWDYDFKDTLTVPANSFETTKQIKVTYNDGNKDFTANQKITITNRITSATIKTQPEQLEYYLGQSFNVKGLVITATLQNGTKDIEVTASNSTVKPEGALSKDVKEVTVTIGGYDIKVPVTVLNALYVEAETGYRNGALIEQSTGDSGNLRVDAMSENVQTNVKTLYEAHLKANFALTELAKTEGFDQAALAAQKATPEELSEALGGTQSVYNSDVTAGGEIVSKLYVETVKWLKAEANKEALDAYVASDEYKAALEAYVEGTNEDIDAWNYAQDVEHYTAHADSQGNEYYLGQNNQGDIISFVYSSSAAAKGSIALRLSSAYLYADSSWKAVIMGDVQFNKLVDIYVNGVKYDIPAEAVLEGGKTEDGSANQILWTNWDTVQLDNVNFVEGRNVVEIRFLNHGIAAQESYNFAANIDTLLVIPNKDNSGKDVCELNTYDNRNIPITAKVNSIVIEEGTLKLSTTLTGAEGYTGDLLSASLGSVAGRVEAGNAANVINVSFDISGLELGDYNITVIDKQLTNEGITLDTTPVTLANSASGNHGDLKFTLSAGENGVINLNVDSDKKATISEVTIGTDIGLKKDNDKVYFVVKGGTYAATVLGYTAEESKDLLASALKAAIYFDLQENPNEGGGSSWGTKLANAHEINILTDTTYELLVDITSLDPNALTIHLQLESKRTSTNGWNDFKPDIDAFAENKVEMLDTMKYELIYDKDHYFACVGVKVSDTAKTFAKDDVTVNTAALENEDGEAVLVVTGTVKNYENNPELTQQIYFATVNNGNFAGNPVSGWGTTVRTKALTITYVAGEEGTATFTAKFKMSELGQSTSCWFHFGAASNDLPANKIVEGKGTLTVGNLKYDLVPQDDATKSPELQITNLAEKKYTYKPVTFEVDEENAKVYYVISGTSENYTKAELETELNALYFDLQNTSGWGYTDYDTIVTVNDDCTFTIKVDVTTIGESKYYAHLGASAENGDKKRPDVGNSGETSVTFGGRTYSYADVDLGGWTGHVFVIAAAPAETPAE